MRVKFLQTREVRDHNNEIERLFEANEVYDLSEKSCERWIKRGVAVLVPFEAVDEDTPPTFVKKKARAKKS